MLKKGLSRSFSYVLDELTDAFPSWVPRLFEKCILAILGNKILSEYYQSTYRRRLGRVKSFDRILFVADVNIGDAITNQQAVKVARGCFPKARIDYLCNKWSG